MKKKLVCESLEDFMNEENMGQRAMRSVKDAVKKIGDYFLYVT